MPAYWPAHRFGGPVVAARELVTRLVEHGHTVDVVTTTLEEVGRRPDRRTRRGPVDGASVTYLATPARYRWMGITPTLPQYLHRLERPDVVHIAGFRDPVTTGVATWCRLRGIPYVFEPLGMLEPRLRKIQLKRALDATLFRGIVSAARRVIVVSPREADDVVAHGIPRERTVVRGLGFPDPDTLKPTDGSFRAALGLDPDSPLLLYVGRIAAGKGIEHLVAAARARLDLHLALVGPDDRHGTGEALSQILLDPALGGRIHVVPPTSGPPYSAYGEATVFALPSAGDSFGLVVAEAAAAGAPVVVTDRCGVASFFADGEALVVPADRDSIIGGITRVLDDPALAAALAAGGREAARRTTWAGATEIQERVYREAAASTSSTNESTLGS